MHHQLEKKKGEETNKKKKGEETNKKKKNEGDNKLSIHVAKQLN